ncbi:ATP-binding cassette transporter ABC2 [Trichodelitschia bisporula]|uniref:ATP-binding cassette transporter ABC2 n=1 Tax=Trichodelitschia bisporula TaxID=703511 RepID=A0A6G1I3Z2_9PEZI|nr:ATP-binding cassette transporter ABC2 [Trichodelitschia bisporula]
MDSASEKEMMQPSTASATNRPSTSSSRYSTGYSPTSPKSPEAGINVARAEAEFAELSRELSKASKAARHGEHDFEKHGDVETAIEADSEEHFNLEETLRGKRWDEEEAGIPGKSVGVGWEDLRVRGVGLGRGGVKTFGWVLVGWINPWAWVRPLVRKEKKAEVDILSGFMGVAKPGEMVLVLGRPGSGCSTFLKTIANQRFEFAGVDGEVFYGRFDAKTFGKRYRGEAVYNGEDDVHYPTLSVSQTLAFALETKIPGKKIAGLSRRAFRERIVDMLLKMFNMEHTRNTMVGDQFVRGVSGGERKRVSIMEMMVTSASVCSWDNSTRGLDSSTALDYAKSLRILTDIYKTSTFVSLYQASENIYSHFDKVLVIDQGRQVFFGPARDARAYFQKLGFQAKPRQTTPDFLTGVTDPFEREYAEGHGSHNTPSTPTALAAAYAASPHAAQVRADLASYRQQLVAEEEVHDAFLRAVAAGKRHSFGRSVYVMHFGQQVWALMRRHFLLKLQDKFSLTVSWATSIIIAVMAGNLWLHQPRDSPAAFTRGGVLFFSLMFNSFQAFGELGATMFGRPILYKHRAYALYTPSALWVAQIAVDFIFGAARITIFSIIVYFMTDLAREVGAFFIYVLTITTGYLALSLYFRTVACLSPDFDVAIRLASTGITIFFLTAGYIIQFQRQHVWLRWVYYLNPMGLGFSALMINEFKRIDLTCIQKSMIPFGPGYGNISHQACTLQGSVEGNPLVSGKEYIRIAFSYVPSMLWEHWGIMVALVVAFLSFNILIGEFITWTIPGGVGISFIKESKERKVLNQGLEQAKERRQKEGTNDKGNTRLEISSKAVLTWEEITYDVPVKSGSKRLLTDIWGYVKPGELTALMGASGAGKTTLLDVLAARKNIGVIGGTILVDGRKPGPAFQRGTSYAEQLDVHEPTATVREALRFAAELRQPPETPREEKYAYVEEILSLLEMEDLADAIIGDAGRGLTVEQRKRVTIGVELAAKPELLLFLDEPTSGLDSQSAFNIVRFLRKLAAAGQAILCTIHQPNSTLFEMFDRLLLLKPGGRCVYFGEIGHHGQELLGYFHRHGAHCPPDANPAEWMLDQIGSHAVIGTDWADIWSASDEFAAAKAAVNTLKTARLAETAAQTAPVQKTYATPLWHQIKTVCRRQSLAFWRTPNYGVTRLFNHIIVCILTGLTYLHLNDSRTSLQYRIFIVFQVTVLPAIILAQVQPKYAMARRIAYREQAARAYHTSPFVLSMVVAELPYSVLCTIAFFLPLYYMPHLQPAPSRAGYQFLMVYILENFAVTLGQAVAALTPSPVISALFNPFIIITMAFFCGVTVPRPQIPKFWRAWLFQLNPYTRLVGGMLVTELAGRKVVCTPDEITRFSPPAGQTCGDYMGPFFARGGPGYLVGAATRGVCEYCAFKTGDQWFQALGYEFRHRWRDMGILVAFVGSNLVILFTAARYLNFNKR